MGKRKILVVDDNEDICLTIKQYLELHDYMVELAYSSTEALKMINSDVDLIVLDIMMEGIDGMELCRMIRDRVDCPIVFVSAKTMEEDKVQALSIGGDDYITKPFSLKELKARIDSHLRREERIRSNERYLLSSKNITIDLLANEVFCKGMKLPFTKKEYEIVKLLMLNKNVVFSKERIFERVWGLDSESQLDTVTESIKNIRKKIKAVDPETSYIQTLYGLGYKWDVTDEKQ
ncbi:response regulator transcription factor [Geobacillus sp. TFV-3]|uniref:response regulator transcription factor n=1 Tax=Geobacillus sp. TFV-3 TaxID=1897059 RepID=UPI00135A9EA0|nr:response regulator transcription factor [Geobacillus sp. TFV-3]KAF0993640.1 Response regulator SaeR [Geobacillus sp. TFV-3]